jgi:hypothetical protein
MTLGTINKYLKQSKSDLPPPLNNQQKIHLADEADEWNSSLTQDQRELRKIQRRLDCEQHERENKLWFGW